MCARNATRPTACRLTAVNSCRCLSVNWMWIMPVASCWHRLLKPCHSYGHVLRQGERAEEAMGTGSGIPWTQDAEREMQTLVLRWDLKTDSIVSLRRAAEGRAHMQVQPSDVRAAWDAHQPKVFPRPLPRPAEGAPAPAAADPTPADPQVPQAPQAPRTITIPSDGGRGNIRETVALDRAGETPLPASPYAGPNLLEPIASRAATSARRPRALLAG